MGAELLSSSQVVYLSLCLYQEPSFIITSLSELKPVTGHWSLFYQEGDRWLVPGFTDRVELSPFFSDSCLIVVGVLAFIVVLWAVVAVVRSCYS